MAGFTRGNVLDMCVAVLGDSSTTFRAKLADAFNRQLYVFWGMHDWNFKHKTGTFDTVALTETYDLVIPSPDIHSAQDIEVLFDIINGRVLNKVDYRTIKKAIPKEDQYGVPTCYAPWGTNTTIYLSNIPDAIYTYKYAYLAIPTEAASDNDNILAVCGLPLYCLPVFEKLVLAEGMLLIDDSRRMGILEEISKLWLPKVIQEDMKHLESGARWKFWEEELTNPTNGIIDPFNWNYPSLY